ncbi:MAG: hypothetical protein IKB16_09555, partial [Lentisphaeria bacterium]|nr:hypothetical protein [Lentisphaeria bacterium]
FNAEAVMGQYYSMSYPRVTLRFTLGCLTLAAPLGLVYRQIQVCLDVKFYTYFTCKTGQFYILYLFIICF